MAGKGHAALDISGESFVASSVEDLEELTEDTQTQPKKMQREKEGPGKIEKDREPKPY